MQIVWNKAWKSLGSGWYGINFPIAALVVLHFVFVARKVLMRHQSFGYCWVLLSHIEAVSKSHTPRRPVGWECARGWKRTKPGQLTQDDQREIPYQIMSCPAIKAKGEDHSSSKEGELIIKAFVLWFFCSKKHKFCAYSSLQSFLLTAVIIPYGSNHYIQDIRDSKTSVSTQKFSSAEITYRFWTLFGKIDSLINSGVHVLYSGRWGQDRMSFPLWMKFK